MKCASYRYLGDGESYDLSLERSSYCFEKLVCHDGRCKCVSVRVVFADCDSRSGRWLAIKVYRNQCF